MQSLKSKTLCLSVVAACSVMLGCRTADDFVGPDHHADIPHGAIPAPLGTYSCEWQQAQTGLAEQDYFVLYRNEWRYGTAEDGTRLGPAGVRRLEEFARRLPHEPFNVVIDRSEDVELDQSRRVAVVGYLSSLGVNDAESRVVVDRGRANDLYGAEAPQIGGGFLRAGGTGTGGQTGSTSGGGGLGGGGLGGGGGGLGGGGFF